MSTPDLLATIVAAARRITEVREAREPLPALERRLSRGPRGNEFLRALTDAPEPRVIAECKRRSPSRGILRRDYDPAAHARAYARNGAAAVSVLTEPTFFDGVPAHLQAVRNAVTLPLLRKDFIVTEYQLLESALLGADAALLIVGALSNVELTRLLLRAAEIGLATLVEVHTAEELRRAVDAGAGIIGVNSRNLKTLEVDRAVLDRLIEAIPRDVVAVAESGISSGDELVRLSAAGYRAFLVGERLIGRDDPGAALSDLRAVRICG